MCVSVRVISPERRRRQTGAKTCSNSSMVRAALLSSVGCGFKSYLEYDNFLQGEVMDKKHFDTIKAILIVALFLAVAAVVLDVIKQ